MHKVFVDQQVTAIDSMYGYTATDSVSTNLAYQLTLLSPRSCQTACRIQYASFFRGTHKVMDDLQLSHHCVGLGQGSRVRVKVLGSVNSNRKNNPKHISNPNPNPTLTLLLTLTVNLP